jgi:FtsH-binding integral membrane protein
MGDIAATRHGRNQMKSAIAAFLSVVLAVLMGFGTLAVLDVAPEAGRDATPIVIFAGIFLIVSGFIYGRWFLRNAGACIAGLAAYAALIGSLVAFFGGTSLLGFFVDWLFLILAVTLVPWFAGLALGKYAQRFQLT